MRFFPLVWAGLWRKRVRTVLAMLSVALAFLLYGTLDGVDAAFDDALVAMTDAARLRTQSRVNVRVGLPLSYRTRIESVPGVRDPLGAFRLLRVSALRDALKAAGDAPLVHGEGWEANLDLLLAAAPHARRIEAVPLPPRYDLRPRESRVRPFSDALRLYRFGRDLRVRRPSLQLAGRS